MISRGEPGWPRPTSGCNRVVVWLVWGVPIDSKGSPARTYSCIRPRSWTMSLLSRFDRPDNVRKLGEKLAAAGTTLEKKDVQALLGAAKDMGSVTAAEKAELKKIFESHGD